MNKIIRQIIEYFENADIKDINEAMEFYKWTSTKINIHQRKTPKRILKKGEIYFTRLGKNIGSEYNKIRPCLIFRNNKFVNSSTVLVIPLSKKTSEKTIVGTDLIIYKNNENRLNVDSVAKVAHIKSISVNRISRYIGKIKKDNIKKIEEKILFLFDIK